MESGDGEKYLHLSAALRVLRGDALDLWGNAAIRHAALRDIVRALNAGDTSLQQCVRRVDDAVVGGLAAVGLPRGPINEVRFVSDAIGWHGRKTSDCSMFLSAQSIERFVRIGQPDDFFRTWVHESLHARQPFSVDYHAEYRLYRGYEEGVVEGLTRHVVLGLAGIEVLQTSVAYYVAAFVGLAEQIGVEPASLLRALWSYAPGTVREALPGAIQRLHSTPDENALTPHELMMLRATADRLFGSDRLDFVPDGALIRSTWKLVFR